MKLTLYQTIAALFLVLGISFTAVPAAHAEPLIIPQQFSYAGLTFVEPITYSKPLPVHKETLVFAKPAKIQVTHQDTEQVIGEIIVQPTITTALTLPVLPTQLPPAVFKNDKDKVANPTPTTKASTQKTPTPTAKVLANASLIKTAEAATVEPTVTPTSAPAAAQIAQPGNPGGLDPEKLFAMSNAFRASRGLPAFQKDERACSLAASRAPEIAGEVASGNMHAGLRARALPYWNSENIISMRTEEAAFNWWVNDKIHHDAIVGNYTYSCVACSGNSCAQEFTNFQPK